MKSSRTIIAGVALTSALLPAAILAAPPVADVNVVNTPDVNVVNTPDVKVVNSASVTDLIGIDFGPISAQNVVLGFSGPVELKAITASVVPEIGGDLCNLNVGAKSPEAVDFTPLGLSVMSNGEAATATRNYNVPVVGIQQIEFNESAQQGNCLVSFSVLAELLPEAPAAAESLQRAGSDGQVRIEVVR